MKRIWTLLLSVMMILGLSACAADTGSPASDKLTVAIVPQAAFVEAVAGDLVEVVTMVPPGNNPETFAPSMAQMRALSDASVYFTLNLPTEQASILPKLSDFNANIHLVDLYAAVAQAYPLLPSAHGHSHAHDDDDHDDDDHDDGHDHEGEYDHHLWLSPRRAVVMVQVIADTLSELDESNRETYQANAARYIEELRAFSAELEERFSALEQRTFIIYHAAYAYFADDYGLDMVGVEIEGKQASAADLQAVITLARERSIKTVLYQQEFDSNQARTIAQEIGGSVLEVAPLSKDYIGALRDIADALTGV